MPFPAPQSLVESIDFFFVELEGARTNDFE